MPAPFDGVLLSAEDAAALWEKIENLEGRLALERERCGQKLAVEQERCFKQMGVAKDAYEQKIELFKGAFARCEIEKQRAWWEDPTLMVGGGVAVGVVAGAALTVGAVWLGAQVRVE